MFTPAPKKDSERKNRLDKRMELTVFFGLRYDAAVRAGNVRKLRALERWARINQCPVLEQRAKKAWRQIDE